MTSRVVLAPKFAGVTEFIQFDFRSSLSAAETIVTQVVTASVYSGEDPSPSGIISGSASATNTVVFQLITGGVAGVIYDVLATVTTSLGQTLQLAGYLAVVPTLP